MCVFAIDCSQGMTLVGGRYLQIALRPLVVELPNDPRVRSISLTSNSCAIYEPVVAGAARLWAASAAFRARCHILPA